MRSQHIVARHELRGCWLWVDNPTSCTAHSLPRSWKLCLSSEAIHWKQLPYIDSEWILKIATRSKSRAALCPEKDLHENWEDARATGTTTLQRASVWWVLPLEPRFHRKGSATTMRGSRPTKPTRPKAQEKASVSPIWCLQETITLYPTADKSPVVDH